MIYVCFAYGMPGCLPNVQDYESYDNEDHAWRMIHQRLSNWRDHEERIAVESDFYPDYAKPMLYPMAPQQIRNWFAGTVTFECHELGRSMINGENLCVVLMSQEDWYRESETPEYMGKFEFDRQPIDNVAEDERMNAIIAGSFNEQMLRPKPIDEFDMHEALDRVSMLATTWSSFVTEARAIEQNRAWHQLAENIEDMMQQLYQMIGDKHL